MDITELEYYHFNERVNSCTCMYRGQIKGQINDHDSDCSENDNHLDPGIMDILSPLFKHKTTVPTDSSLRVGCNSCDNFAITNCTGCNHELCEGCYNHDAYKQAAGLMGDDECRYCAV